MEVACPIYDERVRKRLIHDLNVMLADNVKAREMSSDGTYRKKKQDGPAVNAQETFMRNAMNARRPSAVQQKNKKSGTLLGRIAGLFRRGSKK